MVILRLEIGCPVWRALWLASPLLYGNFGRFQAPENLGISSFEAEQVT